MAKDETEEGITGQPIPRRNLGPRKRHEFEKQRRAARKERGDVRVGDTFSQHRMTGSRGHGSEYQNPVREEVLVDYLLGEGFASDKKSASAIASAMSEEWKQSIVEGIYDWLPKTKTVVPPYPEARKPRFPALTVPNFDLGTEPKPKAPKYDLYPPKGERPVPPRTERPVAPRQKGTESQKPKPKPQVTPAQPKPEATPYKGPGYKKDTSIQDMIDKSKERQQAPKAEAPKPEAPRQPISAGAAGAEGVKFVERGSSSAAGSPAKPIRDRMVGLSPRERAQMGK